MNAALLSFLVSADAENKIKLYDNYYYVIALPKTEMDTKCPTDYIRYSNSSYNIRLDKMAFLELQWHMLTAQCISLKYGC